MAEPDNGGKVNGHPALDVEPAPDDMLANVAAALDAVAAALAQLAGMAERIEHIDDVLREFEPIIRRMADNPAARFMQRTRGG